jgi:hypothetical protein
MEFSTIARKVGRDEVRMAGDLFQTRLLAVTNSRNKKWLAKLTNMLRLAGNLTAADQKKVIAAAKRIKRECKNSPTTVGFCQDLIKEYQQE